MPKIVVIEDDNVIRENLTDILIAHSFEVSAYSDGNLALDYINKNIPDLILCDIMMPVKPGYEILESIKSNPATSNISFIFLTAKSEMTDLRLGMELGADDYLTKPFFIKDLLSAINARLESVKRKTVHDHQLLHQKLDNLSKIISHEYNTPLNGILGLSEILLNTINITNKEVLKENLLAIQESGLKLKKINHRLVNFIEVLDTNTPLSPDIITLEELKAKTNQILNLTAKEYNRKNQLLLTCNIQDYSSYIVFPKIYLENTIKELAQNAFKFSPPDSKVQFDISIKNKRFLHLTVKNKSILKTNFKLEEPIIDLNNCENGEQGLGMGLFIINKLCKIQNCIFSILEKEEVVATIKIKCLPV